MWQGDQFGPDIGCEKLEHSEHSTYQARTRRKLLQRLCMDVHSIPGTELGT